MDRSTKVVDRILLQQNGVIAIFEVFIICHWKSRVCTVFCAIVNASLYRLLCSSVHRESRHQCLLCSSVHRESRHQCLLCSSVYRESRHQCLLCSSVYRESRHQCLLDWTNTTYKYAISVNGGYVQLQLPGNVTTPTPRGPP